MRDSGLPVVLISHNMPHVFEVADRIHVHRLGRRIAVVSPKTHTMSEVVALMTGAAEPGAVGYDQVVKDAERQGARSHRRLSGRRTPTADADGRRHRGPAARIAMSASV